MSVVAHWSCSKFTAWDQCPGEFKARYIDEQPVELTEAMAFGQAVHMGLEAHFRGEDGIRAFRAAWKQYALELGQVEATLTGRGMDLIEQVMDLGLEGVPERGFSIDTNVELGAPIIGFVDLWGADGVTYDFKTTRGSWSQARANRELWQPVLYSMARWLEEPEYDGAFEYIVLNRISGEVQRFRREWTADDIADQVAEVWNRMHRVAALTRADYFECHGKHGICPECGARWRHDHECSASLGRIRLHATG